MLDSIYKKKTHSGHQRSKIESLWKFLIRYYKYAEESEYALCQGFQYAKDTVGSEYMWVCSWIIPEYVCMSEAEPKTTVQATLACRINGSS